MNLKFKSGEEESKELWRPQMLRSASEKAHDPCIEL